MADVLPLQLAEPEPAPQVAAMLRRFADMAERGELVACCVVGVLRGRRIIFDTTHSNRSELFTLLGLLSQAQHELSDRIPTLYSDDEIADGREPTE